MNNKLNLKYKWVAAIPIICAIVYFLLAFCLDKFTKIDKPYLVSLVVFIVLPFEYYIVGLKKFKFIYPIFIVCFYIGICALVQGIWNVSLWHPLRVLLLTIPIYYIFFGEKRVEATKEEVKKDIKDSIKGSLKDMFGTNKNKNVDLDPNDCDFDSSK